MSRRPAGGEVQSSGEKTAFAIAAFVHVRTVFVPLWDTLLLTPIHSVSSRGRGVARGGITAQGQETSMFRRTRIIAAIGLTVAFSVATQPALACGKHRRNCDTTSTSTGSTSSGSTSSGDNGGTPVPAPAALGLFGAGAAGLIVGRRRRKHG